MTDAEVQILRAFREALWQQTDALPELILQQIRAIVASLDTRVVELHDLAVATPALESPYRTAYRWLTENAAERGMGLDALPAKSDESRATGENPNIVRDVRPHVEEMREILVVIDQKLDQASTISKSSDPTDIA